VFQHPQPSLEAMATLYYNDEGLARRLDHDLRGFALDRGRKQLALLASAGVNPGGELLDIGCSSGAWLEVAREAGWVGQGVDIGEPFAARARAKGLDVYAGTIEEAAASVLSGRKFRLITLWDVLEHVPDPLKTLRVARDLLEPGGTVAVSAPNVSGLYPRLTYRLLARPSGVWEYPELPAHLYDFSPATASRVLARAGLTTQFTTTTPVSFAYYRATSLAGQLSHRGRRGRALGLAFEALRVAGYPLARATNRGNALFLIARHEEPTLRG